MWLEYTLPVFTNFDYVLRASKYFLIKLGVIGTCNLYNDAGVWRQQLPILDIYYENK